MRRRKKDREINIVHFSFFDLLFGAFGTFIFLMIFQVITSLNLVDKNIEKLVENTVKEKNELKKRVEDYKQKSESLTSLKTEYDQMINERKSLLATIENLSQKNNDTQQQMAALNVKLNYLNKLKDEMKAKEKIQRELDDTFNTIKTLKEDKEKLEITLNQLKTRLDMVKEKPLTLRTRTFPSTMTGENIHFALAAEGGILPYTWKLDGRLPDGLLFNQTSGVITGIPQKTGQFLFKIEVTDARGTSVKSENQIKMNIIKSEPSQKRVSQWFVIIATILSIYVINKIWQKHKITKMIKEMRDKGYEPGWIKKGHN